MLRKNVSTGSNVEIYSYCLSCKIVAKFSVDCDQLLLYYLYMAVYACGTENIEKTLWPLKMLYINAN